MADHSIESSHHAEREAAASSLRAEIRHAWLDKISTYATLARSVNDATESARLDENRCKLDSEMSASLAQIDETLANVEDELHQEILLETRKMLAKWASAWYTRPSRELAAALGEIVAKLAPRTQRELGVEFDFRNILIAMANEVIAKQPQAAGIFGAHLMHDQACLGLGGALMRSLSSAAELEQVIREIEKALAWLAENRQVSGPTSAKRWKCVCSAATYGRRAFALGAFNELENRERDQQLAREHAARIDSAPKNPNAWFERFSG